MTRFSLFRLFSLLMALLPVTGWHSHILPKIVSSKSVEMACSSDAFATMMIVPTGIGAAIGGYAGDALPAAKLLAAVSDILITHPNVLNGAMLYWPIPNALYVEGYALDEFASNRWKLSPVRHGGNSLGLLLDKGMSSEQLARHLQVANAARATLGINVAHSVVTEKALGVSIDVSDTSGASWGTIRNVDALLDGARRLRELGCDAIAVVAKFPDDSELGPDGSDWFAKYRTGDGVDLVAGAEALISHLVTKELRVPCAHAPASSSSSWEDFVAPKACAEEIGHTFLPCVLAYLHRAPTLLPAAAQTSGPVVTADDVSVVVAPFSALGGPAVMALMAKGKKVIAVEENASEMRVSPLDLPKHLRTRIIRAHSYAEAAGLVVALREGIWLPSLSSAVSPLQSHG